MIHCIANEDQAEEFARETGMRDSMLEKAFVHRFEHPEHHVCVYQKLVNPKKHSIALLCYFDGFRRQDGNGWWAVRFDDVKTKKDRTKATRLIKELIKRYEAKMKE